MKTFGIPKVENLARRGDVRGLLRALEYEDATVNGDRRFANKGASVRAQAVAALGRVGTPEADAGLVRALADPDEAVRAAALAALKERGGGTINEELVRAVSGWTSDEQATGRLAAVQALAATGAADAPVRLIEELMSRPGAAVESDREVLRRLAESSGGMEQAVAHLVSMLGDGRSDSRAMTMLTWLAPESVQPLIDALREPGRRQQAALALGYIRDPRAAEALRPLMLTSPDPHMRRVSAWALGKIGDPEASKALLASIAPPAEEAAQGEEEDASVDEAPSPSPESLRTLDLDGLAELYEIAVEAWRAADRAHNAEEAERWHATTDAIVDEARDRPGGEESAQQPRQPGFLVRRRERRRAQLLAACAERAAADT